MRFVYGAAVMLSLLACDTSEPTCDECLAQTEPALSADGCWPYCDGDTADADGDGVGDSADACPTDPETVNGYKDGDGCPDVLPEPLPLPPEIDGAWSGVTTLAVNGDVYNKSHSVGVVSSTGWTTGAVAGFCPDGSGEVPLTATTVAPNAAWSGIYSCPPGPWGACSDGLPIYANMLLFSAVVRPTASGIQIETTGAVTFTDNDGRTQRPCEQTGQFVAVFIGSR